MKRSSKYIRTLRALVFAALLLAPVAAMLSRAPAAPDASLVKVNYRAQGDDLIVTLSGSDRMRYRVQEYDTPPHILVQIYNMRSSLPYQSLPGKGNIRQVDINQVDINGAPATFVKIALAKKSKFDFDVSASGKEMWVSVTGAARGAAPASMSGGRKTIPAAGALPSPMIMQPGISMSDPSSGANKSGDGFQQFGNNSGGASGPSPYIVGPIEFVDAPFSKVMQTLHEVTNTQIAVEATLIQTMSGQGGMAGTSGPQLFTMTFSHISLEDALDVLCTSNNLVWRKVANTYMIMTRETAEEGVETVKGTVFADSVDKMNYVIIKTKYIPACRLLNPLTSAVPNPGYLTCDVDYSYIVYRGTKDDIQRVRDVVRSLDTQEKDDINTQNEVVKVIKLQYISTAALKSAVEPLFTSRYFGNIKVYGTNIYGDTGVTGDAGKEALQFDDRTNTLIFVGHKLIYDRLMLVIKQLDVPESRTILKIIPLKYLRAQDVADSSTSGEGEGGGGGTGMPILRSFISGQGGAPNPRYTLQFDESTNSLIYSGVQEDYEKLMTVLNVLDVELREIVTEIITVQNIRVQDIQASQLLRPILGVQEYGFASVIETSAGGTSARIPIGTRSFISIIPDGSRVIITGQRQYVDKIKEFFKKIDVADNLIQTKIYRLNYMPAIRVGAALKNMITLAGGAGAGGESVIPLGGGFYDCAQGTSDECKLKGIFSGSTVPTSGGFVDSANLSVYVESVANALVVRGHVLDLKKIEEYIKLVDVSYPQIQIDVQVVEVRKDASKKVSSLIQAMKRKGFEIPYAKQLGIESGDSPSVFFTTQSDSKEINAFISDLVSNDEGRIIANPSVIARENTRAILDFRNTYRYTVSNPVVLGGGTSTTTQQTSLQEVPIGVLLYVRAHVNLENRKILVYLEPTVTNMISKDSRGIPETGTRSLETEAFVDDGAPIVLAGLIQNHKSDVRSKTPMFGDLPLVGKLFRSQTTETKESEVIFIITPTILWPQ